LPAHFFTNEFQHLIAGKKSLSAVLTYEKQHLPIKNSTTSPELCEKVLNFDSYQCLKQLTFRKLSAVFDRRRQLAEFQSFFQ
jgi:hypothetical protein